MWDAHTYQHLRELHTPHRGNIFSAHVLPWSDDNRIASCAADGKVVLTHVDTGDSRELLAEQPGFMNSIALVPLDPHCFISVGDYGVVYLHDLREPRLRRLTRVRKLNGSTLNSIYSVSAHPWDPMVFAVAGTEPVCRVLDRRSLRSALALQCADMAPHSVTGIAFDGCGERLLASYEADTVALFDTNKATTVPLESAYAGTLCDDSVLRTFTGHVNRMTVKGVRAPASRLARSALARHDAIARVCVLR